MTIASAGLGLCSPTEGDCNLHKLVGASTRAAVLWLPAVYRESHFAFRARGAATDAAAIRSPSKCSGGAALLTPPPQVQHVGAKPLTAVRCPTTSKHGVHAHAPRTATSLRDALTVPPATNDTNEAPQPFQADQDRVAAAVACRTSKKKGPAHVPHARDWLRSSRTVEDP